MSIACGCASAGDFGSDVDSDRVRGAGGGPGSSDFGDDTELGREPQATETCGNGMDDDLNGVIDDNCGCSPGATQACFPSGRLGACGGTQTCNSAGEFGEWGPCMGAPTPTAEICGDGIDQDCDGMDMPCNRPTDACATSPHITDRRQLMFMDPLRTLGPCPWGQGDNLSHLGGKFAARHEVTQDLNLPAGAVLCNASFSVPQTGMYYDDFMFIVWNDILVLAPFDMSNMLETRNGMLVYDWLRMRGQGHNNGPVYCPGAGSTCGLPDTEQNGSIQLNLDDAVVRQIADEAVAQGRHAVTVVATGDDNPGDDCTFSDFELDVQIDYVMP